MKSNNVSKMILLFSILIQFVFIQFNNLFTLELPYITGLACEASLGESLEMIFLMTIPIPFFLWVCSGEISNILYGNGKVYIIRKARRSRMFMKITANVIKEAALMALITYILFTVFCKEEYETVGVITRFEIILIYYMVLCNIALFMYLLELFQKEQIAHMITTVYFVLSLFIYPYSIKHIPEPLCQVVLFPNLMFTGRNGIIEYDMFPVSFMMAAGIGVILEIIIVKVLNKKDIL